MFKHESRLSLAIAMAVGLAATACTGGANQSPLAGEISAPAATPTSAVAPPPTSADTAPTATGTESANKPATPKSLDSAKPAGALPLLVVTKSPTCGCCHLWVEHMQNAGFKVEVHDVDDINLIKERVGVPYGKGSCHTAEVGGYFVEGHVPAEDVKRLLAERPDARGLTVPGMPMGSPGMEVPDGRVQPYAVELVARDGSTSEFAHHGH